MHSNKDEAKLYEALDLAEVDKLFSAYQKNGKLFWHVFCFYNLRNGNFLTKIFDLDMGEADKIWTYQKNG